MTRLLALFTFITFPVLAPVHAATLADVSFQDKVQVGEEQQLVLNGLGLRKATLFGIHVYVGALYLEEKESSSEKILSEEGRRRIVMHFLRDVDSDSLRDAWRKGLEKNAEITPEVDAGLRQLNSLMQDVEEGQRFTVDFYSDGGVSVTDPAGDIKRVSEGGFALPLLSVWLGPKPPNADLKSGMLGKSD